MLKTIGSDMITLHSNCCPNCGCRDFEVSSWHVQICGYLFEWSCSSCSYNWQEANTKYRAMAEFGYKQGSAWKSRMI